MSWSEVKKINSNLDKPLDKLFGFEFFKQFTLQSFEVSGVKGIAIVRNRYSGAEGIEVDNCSLVVQGETAIVIPFSNRLRATNARLDVIIFTLGGGY